MTKETDLEQYGHEATGRDAGATKTGESGTGLPKGLQREFSPADTWIWGLLASDCKRVNLCCMSHQFVVIYPSIPRKLIPRVPHLISHLRIWI